MAEAAATTGGVDPISAALNFANTAIAQIGSYINNRQLINQQNYSQQTAAGDNLFNYYATSELNSQTIFGKALDEQKSANTSQVIIIVAVLLVVMFIVLFALKKF